MICSQVHEKLCFILSEENEYHLNQSLRCQVIHIINNLIFSFSNIP
jgi:hypothetical protein